MASLGRIQESIHMRMSTVHFTIFTAIVAILPLASPSGASAEALKPFKDDLFSKQTVIESHDNGAFETIDYQEMRDINGLDEIPERRVKGAYVSLGVRWKQQDQTLTLGDRKIDVARTGLDAKQAFTVIFIHGRGGDRRLGSNDYTFGGNFNRLKNLAVDNGGTYYAPSVKSFDSEGVADVAALIRYSYEQSGGKPVVLTCASMGSFVCWGITRDAESVKRLKGMAILGGATDPDFMKSAFYKARLPLWFTHGGNDPVYPPAAQEALFEKLYKGNYPARFTLFATGSHGTPVRMTDWRTVLNWIMATRP
jgi:pimeloyl-ACP methyl ester carboxylesterase